jgi:hypothetical protein
MVEWLFVDLFRALINGRRRYLRRVGTNNGEGQPACDLAKAVDRFLQAAGPFYSDAEVFLRLMRWFPSMPSSPTSAAWCGKVCDG